MVREVANTGFVFVSQLMRQRHGDQQARVDSSSCGEVREKVDYEVVVFRGGYAMRIYVAAGFDDSSGL